MTFYKGQNSPLINATVVSTAKFDAFSIVKADDHELTGVEVSRAKISPVAHQFQIRFPPPEKKFQGRYTLAISSLDIRHTFQLNILEHESYITTPPKTIAGNSYNIKYLVNDV